MNFGNFLNTVMIDRNKKFRAKNTTKESKWRFLRSNYYERTNILSLNISRFKSFDFNLNARNLFYTHEDAHGLNFMAEILR